ncbi:MAG: hypothetical protein ACYCPW_02120 [Nitrososphaerales archaeon]
MSLTDATQELQRTISDACQSGKQIKLEKGNYAVQTLEIPKNCKLLLFSKDRVRILYSGRINRPLFVLQENSILTLQEKIEIYYNTNNVQEVDQLMIKRPESGRVEISKGVKISLFSMK